MKNVKILFFLIVLFSAVSSVFSQVSSSVPEVLSIEKDGKSNTDVNETIAKLKQALKTEKSNSEKMKIYAFMASLQEQLGLYQDAKNNYSLAANYSASVNKTAGSSAAVESSYLLGAVRCALSTGDTVSADYILSTAFLSSGIDAETQSYVKLYAVWSWLCKISSESELAAPVAVLKQYLTLLPSQSVKPAVLITLWYLTGDNSYADTLKKDFASAPETAVIKGEAYVMPAPFWYFVPAARPDARPDDKKDSSAVAAKEPAGKAAESAKASKDVIDSASAGQPAKAAAEKTAVSKETASNAAENESSGTASNTAVKQQLGLFRDRVNAEALVERLKAAGFAAEISTEKRTSGNTYYLVTVPEKADGSVGDRLRKSGFECYPVYE